MSSSSPRPKAAFYGRTLDRLQALQLLFQAEATRRSIPALLDDVYLVSDDVIVADDNGRKENLVTTGPIRPYARELVLGVVEHRSELDAEIADRSVGWDFSRITPVDRNVLRVALFELIWEDGIDDAVCASEAVRLAKALGGEDSHRFVNGILGAVARSHEKAQLRKDPDGSEDADSIGTDRDNVAQGNEDHDA